MNLFLSHFLPKRAGIPVLMYHKVETESADSLTVTVDAFTDQLHWLKKSGYESISLQCFLEVLEGKKHRDELPARPILITFDDGYQSTLTEAAPILAKFDFRATLFATSAYIDEKAPSVFMSADDLETWNQKGHEIALHSHTHPNYGATENSEILSDLKTSLDWFAKNKIKALSALAYPFGARPKEKLRKIELKNTLQQAGVIAAFRIGNKIATWKSLDKKRVDPFEIPRIDIRGDDNLKSFSIKVQKGRIRPFQ
jgi:peptidoglycan/xylan/chitin deacetylase (PgdA/CDA1 family)